MQSQPSVAQQTSREVSWIVVAGFLYTVSLAWHVALVSFRRLCSAHRLVELGLRRCKVPADRVTLAAGGVVFAAVVASAVALHSVGVYWWHKLSAYVAAT